jgi:ubiquinol-cytochrome c reductase cytochrome b subunit
MLFTGQILRWDDFGMWTLSILSFISSRVPLVGDHVAHFLFGGPTMEGDTLARVFTLHVFILPGLVMAVVGLHLYLVLKLGISESPRRGRPVTPKSYRDWYESLLHREGVPFWPDAAWRDVVFGIVVVGAIFALAVFVGPTPLGLPPDPTHVVTQPRPDWYFTWLFAGFALVPKEAENVAMIGAPLVVMVGLLIVPFVANAGERAPTRRPWAVATVVLVVVMVASLTVTGLIAPWSPRFTDKGLSAQVTQGLTGAPARGAALFSSAGCQFCHSLMNSDGGIAGPSLENIGGQLTASELTIRILNGGTNMPAFGRILSPAQVHDLVAFLLTRKQWKTGGNRP